VADDPKPPPPPPAPPAGGALEDRVAGLEAGQQSLSGKVDQVLAALGGGKDPAPAGDGKDPAPAGGVAAEIRQQLDERDARERAAAAERDRDGRLGALEQSVKDMGEKAPAPLPRRVEKMMGWTS
jgi:hypothetical protein